MPDAETDDIDNLRRGLNRLRAENSRLARLLDLRGDVMPPSRATRRGTRPARAGHHRVLLGRQARAVPEFVWRSRLRLRRAMGEPAGRNSRLDAGPRRRLAQGVSIAEHLAAEVGTRFASPAILRDKVAAGHLGRSWSSDEEHSTVNQYGLAGHVVRVGTS